jgi:uracil-DNA glycosylase
MDASKALRRTEAVESGMDVFIVSQALAEGQLRKSGVNFFTAEGRLGNTGRNLEKFLNQFNRTVYPPREVRLASGAVVRRAAAPFLSVYNTELTQCFPGKTGYGDRVPTATEIVTCLGKGFLEREISLIRPRLLLLMGDNARKAFYKHFVETPRTDTLRAHLEGIVALGQIPVIKIDGVKVSVLPIQHASGRNPHFYEMLKSPRLIGLIQHLLAQPTTLMCR